MSGKIEIDKQNLSWSNTQIDEMNLTHGNGEVSVDDSSKELLSNCISVMQKTANSLSSTVQNYDKFIHDLVAKFEEKDAELSKVFGATPSVSAVGQKSSSQGKNASDDYFSQSSQYRHSRQKARELMDKADNPYYNMLP